MPRYDYRCLTCDTVFEERRTMAAADDPAICPGGHRGAARLLADFVAVGSLGEAGRDGPCADPVAGGGCGDGCVCHLA